MKREIKFRAWINYKMCGPIFPGNCSSCSWDNPGEGGAFDMYDTRTGKNQYPIMQFTGIKDENGKEIYEGDILLDDNGRILQVEWVNLRFRFKALRPTNFFYANEIMQWFMDGFKWPKVIGNIYENPELLENK